MKNKNLVLLMLAVVFIPTWSGECSKTKVHGKHQVRVFDFLNPKDYHDEPRGSCGGSNKGSDGHEATIDKGLSSGGCGHKAGSSCKDGSSGRGSDGGNGGCSDDYGDERDIGDSGVGGDSRISSACGSEESAEQNLISIAQKAAQEASNAAASEKGAGRAASKEVKTQMAKNVELSAKAAEAAMAGGQQLLEQLRDKSHTYQMNLQSENMYSETAETYGDQATLSVKQAHDAFKKITEALQFTKTNTAQAKVVAKSGKRNLGERRLMRDELYCIHRNIMHQGKCAEKELISIEKSAHMAANAASDACNEAARARVQHHHKRDGNGN